MTDKAPHGLPIKFSIEVEIEFDPAHDPADGPPDEDNPCPDEDEYSLSIMFKDENRTLCERLGVPVTADLVQSAMDFYSVKLKTFLARTITEHSSGRFR